MSSELTRRAALGLGLAGALAAATAATAAAAAPRLVIEVAGEARGRVVIELLPEVAPNHVARVLALAAAGAYDGVAFHRVIDGFMAQTGDVRFGRAGGDLALAGTGGSELPDLRGEFSDLAFRRGTVGMARARSPDSANSQFFIMLGDGRHLDGDYTLFGRVVEGMEVVDRIRRGDRRRNGLVADPDRMVRVTAEP